MHSAHRTCEVSVATDGELVNNSNMQRTSCRRRRHRRRRLQTGAAAAAVAAADRLQQQGHRHPGIPIVVASVVWLIGCLDWLDGGLVGGGWASTARLVVRVAPVVAAATAEVKVWRDRHNLALITGE
eukprot:364358-Chlamydomonas_euryale.AAC.20